MKTSTATQIVVTVIAALLLVYGIIFSFGSAGEVDTKVQELTPEQDKVEIDTAILENKDIKNAEALKRFGTTLAPSAGNLNRANPFEGI